ncbi:unnamed protein product [Cyclocybe aegerita]|uniref:Uncharacterized protein n=1 Tax=Cyclocybe aegerita TaxID=1973307 RepID=A0A8S0VYV0_CYCAE|nr:unnamed protein product [Cyclocybe aegerita]
MSDPSTSKAIGSLAKRQPDVTRQGTQKLKFVPTLPQRRKKDEVKPEPAPAVIPSPSQADRGHARGRGNGDARGRGRGRGAPPIVEMTASGPFAMGPTQASSSARRSALPSNIVSSTSADASTSNIGVNLSQMAPPSLKREAGKAKSAVKVEDEEVYSDPDEGVEIIDMENVRQMDWMAPESLRKERQTTKKGKKEEGPDEAGDTTNFLDALDLSESDDEEELEDIIEDFATQADMVTDESMREDRLYLFQFPIPFPTFRSKKASAMNVEPPPDPTTKKVSFAPDVKPDMDGISSRTASSAPSEVKKSDPIDGLVGQLEVYRSGAVKIRFANGVLLDVNAATQPSFLQQAVYLDTVQKQLVVLGEVNKQFIVSPNVDALLEALESEETTALSIEGEESLLTMDQS